MTTDTPAGVIDMADRYPTLSRLGAFTMSGWPVNGVGNIRDLIANYAQEIAFLNPFLTYGKELSISNLIGPDGLYPRPKLDPGVLNLTEQQAEDLEEQFEHLFTAWANSRCGFDGDLTFRQVLDPAFRRSFDAGEVLLGFHWHNQFGSQFATRVSAIDPQRISRTGALVAPGNTALQGIELDPNRRPVAVWIMPRLKQYGFQVAETYNGTPERFEFRSPWGRHLIAHAILDRQAPGVVRGVSPIASALQRAFQLDSVTDLTIASMQAQLAVAWSLVSEFDANEASGAFGDLDPMQRVHKNLEMLEAHFSVMPMKLPATAKAAILPKGSKLTATAAQFPTYGYDLLTKRLVQELSRAFGLTYSELSGDYSQDNFSSAKMASEGPWRITYSRRKSFAAPLYQAAYENVIEEAIMREYVKPPRRAASFYALKDAWTCCDWRGPAKPIVDPLKEAHSNDIELTNGTTSRAQVAAERGLDWRDLLEQQAREQRYAERIGLTLTTAKAPAQPVAQPVTEE